MKGCSGEASVPDANDTRRQSPSPYYEHQRIAEAVARGEHRALVGGLWDELGSLQFNTLRTAGLRAEHRLLDLGCGSLRGGLHFIRYLDAGNYYGIDANESLLDAGVHVELPAAGLTGRIPEENLRCDSSFDVACFGRTFHMALAFSLFTHLPAAFLRACLVRLAQVMEPGGTFYASFFLLPEHRSFAEPFAQTPEITTHACSDPYHYRITDIRDACQGQPWSHRVLEDWRHPRNQRMVIFEHRPSGLR